MCTAISRPVEVQGHVVGFGQALPIARANLSYDHPSAELSEHAVLLDLFDADSRRVGLEISPAAARRLAADLLRVADEADDYERVPV